MVSCATRPAGGRDGRTIRRVTGIWGGDCVEPDDLQFDHLKQVNSLVNSLLEAAALFCFQARPLKWSEVGARLTAWTGERLTDSQITRSLNRLTRQGFINKIHARNDKRDVYHITDAGRVRVIRIAALIKTIEKIEDGSDG